MKTHYNCKGHISIKTKENKYDIVKVQKRVYGDSTEASDDFHNLFLSLMFIFILYNLFYFVSSYLFAIHMLTAINNIIIVSQIITDIIISPHKIIVLLSNLHK